jgi:hypothetical protein
MHSNDYYFVIPTYRLRDVGETIELYDEHFWRNGHSPRLIVFDDSIPVNQQKYFSLLEQTTTHNDVYYVGPREKDQFIAYLNQRLSDKRLDGLVKNLFRPSYGGNRNCTLMYTLGGKMISADDDMRPIALMEHSPESLEPDEVCRFEDCVYRLWVQQEGIAAAHVDAAQNHTELRPVHTGAILCMPCVGTFARCSTSIPRPPTKRSTPLPSSSSAS